MEKQKKKKLNKYRFMENLELFGLSLPGLIFLLIFSYWPMYGIIIAFKKFNPNLGIWGSEWVGFKNFEFFFTSQDAGRVLRNTLLYSTGWLILGMVCAIALAVLFYNLHSGKALKVYNTIVILPRFLSMVLIAYIVYALLSHSYGVVNQVIEAFGGKEIRWYTKPEYWPYILTTVKIWSVVGMDSILYYASLMGLDGELLEAAQLDGANTWQRTKYIMVPHLIPTIVVLMILGIGGLFDAGFDLFYQVTKNQGMLYPTTDVIGTYVYRALIEGSLEKSAAINLFQNIMGFILVVGTNLIVKRVSPEDSLF